ncbi:MAG: hypothetical protein WHV67_02735 [Thermoanaerobaculia bacterium]
MKFLKIFLFVLLCCSLAFSQNLGGLIVADTPGAYNSYWHTSITLMNFSQQDAVIPATLYLNNGQSFKFHFEVKSQQSISKLLIEILKENEINLPTFFGWVEIDLSGLPEEFSGFAAMYTPDPNAGEGAIFSEITPIFMPIVGEFALYPLTPCGSEAKEPMALGGAVWRTNVGFVNTSSKQVTINVECYDGKGMFLAHTSVGLNPKEIKQLNDVKRPEIWNIPCQLIKEPVICFGDTAEYSEGIYVYAANNNNVNNFPIYISPQ